MLGTQLQAERLQSSGICGDQRCYLILSKAHVSICAQFFSTDAANVWCKEHCTGQCSE